MLFLVEVDRQDGTGNGFVLIGFSDWGIIRGIMIPLPLPNGGVLQYGLTDRSVVPLI